MKPLSWLTLITLTACGFIAGYATNAVLLQAGYYPIRFTPALGIVSALIAGALLVLGRRVRHFRDGDKHAIYPITALKIALFARSSALVCAALLGVCGGVAVSALTRIEAPAIFDAFLGSCFAGLGLLAWMVAGIVVEKWGQRPDDPDQSTRVSTPNAQA